MTPTLEQASHRGRMGALAAASHADKVTKEWTTTAGCLFVDYAKHVACGKPFLTEDVREWAEHVIGCPPDGRAWGHVAKAIAAEGLVVHAGYGPAKSSNGSPKVLWRAA